MERRSGRVFGELLEACYPGSPHRMNGYPSPHQIEGSLMGGGEMHGSAPGHTERTKLVRGEQGYWSWTMKYLPQLAILRDPARSHHRQYRDEA